MLFLKVMTKKKYQKMNIHNNNTNFRIEMLNLFHNKFKMLISDLEFISDLMRDKTICEKIRSEFDDELAILELNFNIKF